VDLLRENNFKKQIKIKKIKKGNRWWRAEFKKCGRNKG
jgi:hypothetical protein